MPRTARTHAFTQVPQAVSSYTAVAAWITDHSKITLAIELLVDNAVLLTAWGTAAYFCGPILTFVLSLLTAAIYLYERLFGRLQTGKVVEAVCDTVDLAKSRWEARKARAVATAY